MIVNPRLILFALLGTVCSKPVCPNDCTLTDKYHEQHFKHVSDLNSSSVAPWNLTLNTREGREPSGIEHAVCADCTVRDMISKPIYFQISVYQRIRTPAPGNSDAWCKCPYELAVGCTCVMKQ